MASIPSILLTGVLAALAGAAIAHVFANFPGTIGYFAGHEQEAHAVREECLARIISAMADGATYTTYQAYSPMCGNADTALNRLTADGKAKGKDPA